MPSSEGRIIWDAAGEREYHTGVDRGVLFTMDGSTGAYESGVAWNGLSSVSESPEGAEPTDIYADNTKYITLMSAEKFKATIEAYMYPDEFMDCDGTAEIAPGVRAGQQNRKKFGFVYRTIKGNDVAGDAFGYVLHFVYGCQASPSEKAHSTVNDSPEAVTFSWEVSTTPVSIPTLGLKPTATIEIDSTKVDASKLAALEDIIYGKDATTGETPTAAVAPRLPLPEEIATLMAAA